MKDVALALARAQPNPASAQGILREYLQAYTLRSLHDNEAFRSLSFVGGTALRFVFDLPRFSEDLDFSLEDRTGYEPREWMTGLERDLSLAGFDVAVAWNDRKTVHVGWLRVPGILHEAGIAGTAAQKLSIKIEVDTTPPAGAVTERRVINRHVLFSLQHHDLPSLMAGKVHALLTRPYTKGRDWYDLCWYRARQPPVEPNRILLQNALDQTEGGGTIDAGRWKELVRARLAASDAFAIERDAAPFLERSADAALLSPENLRSVLG